MGNVSGSKLLGMGNSCRLNLLPCIYATHTGASRHNIVNSRPCVSCHSTLDMERNTNATMVVSSSTAAHACVSGPKLSGRVSPREKWPATNLTGQSARPADTPEERRFGFQVWYKFATEVILRQSCCCGQTGVVPLVPCRLATSSDYKYLMRSRGGLQEGNGYVGGRNDGCVTNVAFT